VPALPQTPTLYPSTSRWSSGTKMSLYIYFSAAVTAVFPILLSRHSHLAVIVPPAKQGIAILQNPIFVSKFFSPNRGEYLGTRTHHGKKMPSKLLLIMLLFSL
jgi:hypothetical protein